MRRTNGARPTGPAKRSRTYNRAGGAEGARFSTIAAKYPGKCRRCGGAINPGDAVRWAPRQGTYHLRDLCGLSPDEEAAAVEAMGEPVPTDEELAALAQPDPDDTWERPGYITEQIRAEAF